LNVINQRFLENKGRRIMSLQIVDTNVAFGFPLQPTGSTPVKEELVKPIDAKTQYRVTVSYTVKPVQPQQ
jgi:hypothetical protein